MTTELYPWQVAELNHSEPRRLIRADPRLGKTRVGIEWLRKVDARVSIIVAPLVVCPQWKTLLEADSDVLVLPLYSKSPKAVSALLGTLNGQQTPFRIVVNYDKLKGLVEQLIKLKPGALILDESHYIKAPGSSRGRAARRLAHNTPHVRLLTGTVAPNGPGDLWGQFTCIDRDIWGSSYTGFKNKHLIIDNFMYDRVVGVRDPVKLQKMIDKGSGSYRRDDVFGADQWQTVVRSFDLEPKARKIYDTIVKDWVLEQEKDGHQLTMTHTLSRMKRLQQLTSGYLPNEAGEPNLIHENKIDLVMEDLDEIMLAGEKAVIFHQFRWEGHEYEQRCRAAGYTVYVINGGTDAARRNDSIVQFGSRGNAAVFIIQTSAGGIGISLATATHCLFVSQSYSFDVEQQARDRIFSPGKSRCVTYYRARRSIDNYISALLESKSDFNAALSRSAIHDIAFGDLELPGYKGF